MKLDLDAIDWSQVYDAYGPAKKVPQYIRSLTAPKAKVRRKALEDLTNAINHQGQVTPAAVEAAPFLVAAALEPATPDKGPLLALLADLAVGGNHIGSLISGYEVRTGPFAEGPDEHPLKILYRHIAAGADGYRSLLETGDTPARIAAPLVLAFLSDQAEGSIAPIRRRIEIEQDEKARASAVLCLGYLARYLKTDEDEPRLRKIFAETEGLVRLAAGIALMEIGPAQVGPEVEAALLDGFSQHKEPVPDFFWCEGELDNFLASTLCCIGEQKRDLALLRKLLDLTAGLPTQATAGRDLLHAAFAEDGDEPRAAPRRPSELRDEQREALREVLERGLWPRLQRTLAAHGIPRDEAPLRRFLGLEPAGPLDREVAGEPLWRLGVRALRGDATPDEWITAVTEGQQPAEILATCEETISPPYALDTLFPVSERELHREELAAAAATLRLVTQALSAGVPRARLMEIAEELLRRERAPEGWCAAVAAALHELSTREGAAFEERWDGLLLRGAGEPYAEVLRPIVEQLPEPRRESLVLALDFDHFEDEDEEGYAVFVRGGWLLADLCPTARVAEKVVETIRMWDEDDEPVPEEHALAVLAALGDAALPALRRALAAGEGTHRELLHEAIARIRGNAAAP